MPTKLRSQSLINGKKESAGISRCQIRAERHYNLQLTQSSYLQRHSIIGTADSEIGLLEIRLKATMISRQPFEHFL
jgi:hypothetical protein